MSSLLLLRLPFFLLCPGASMPWDQDTLTSSSQRLALLPFCMFHTGLPHRGSCRAPCQSSLGKTTVWKEKEGISIFKTH